MKQLVFVIFFFTASVANAQNNSESNVISMDSLFRLKAQESIGKKFPSFNTTSNNRPFNNDSLKGKTVFINFWFAACPPCIAELRALNNLYKKFSKYPGFEFVSFTYESRPAIIKLKRKYPLPYRIISINRQECYRLNQNNGFPTSIILDRNGVIRHLFTGGNDERKKAEAFIYDTVYKKLAETLDLQ